MAEPEDHKGPEGSPKLMASPLPNSDDIFRLIAENVRDYAIFTLDPRGVVTTWNVGAERILGYSDEEMVGTSSRRIFVPEDQESGAPEQEIQTAVSQGRAADERWHLRKDGSRFYASGILTALRDEDGRLRGFVKILRDFTERKKAEEALRGHQTEIERLNRRLQRAMTETHHRVKNSLQVITSMLDMLMLRHESQVSVKELARLVRHIQTLAVIHDLLTSQVRTGGATDTISSRAALDRLLPMLEHTTGDRPLHHDIDDIPLAIGQGSALAALISELVSNAVKHGRGAIRVDLKASGGIARLVVADEGSGFPPGFDPRGSANTGLELLLSLAHWDLRGQIAYENAPAGGARVRVTFPYTPVEEV